MLAEIADRRCAEDGVSDGMGGNVRIGGTDETGVVVDAYTRENDGSGTTEAVGIEPESDQLLSHDCLSSITLATRARSSG